LTPNERAKAVANSVRVNALDDLETTCRLAIRAAIEDDRESVIRLCMQFADKIDPGSGGDHADRRAARAIRELTTKIRELPQ